LKNDWFPVGELESESAGGNIINPTDAMAESMAIKIIAEGIAS